mgnify:CR=1 FL=1
MLEVKMSRSRTRYDKCTSELVISVPETYVVRAATRLQTQGASGLAVLGARVLSLVRVLGGNVRRGPPPSLATERWKKEKKLQRKKGTGKLFLRGQ